MRAQMSESGSAIALRHASARVAVCAFLVALVCALGACSDKPSAKACEKLLDRVIEFEIEAGGTNHLSPAMKDDLDKQRKELREYLSEPFLDDCRNNMPVAVVECGLEAKSLADYAKCEN